MGFKNRVRKRSENCTCEFNFTCGECLRNPPPYFFTPTKTIIPARRREDRHGRDL